jgi:hypothetical protein
VGHDNFINEEKHMRKLDFRVEVGMSYLPRVFIVVIVEEHTARMILSFSQLYPRVVLALTNKITSLSPFPAHMHPTITLLSIGTLQLE